MQNIFNFKRLKSIFLVFLLTFYFTPTCLASDEDRKEKSITHFVMVTMSIVGVILPAVSFSYLYKQHKFNESRYGESYKSIPGPLCDAYNGLYDVVSGIGGRDSKKKGWFK